MRAGARARRPSAPLTLSVHLQTAGGLGFLAINQGIPWKHSFRTLESSQECLRDLPQERRRRIFNIQDISAPCQVLCQELLYIKSLNHHNDLVAGY